MLETVNSCIIINFQSLGKTLVWKDTVSHILSYEEYNIYSLLYTKENDAEIEALIIRH